MGFDFFLWDGLMGWLVFAADEVDGFGEEHEGDAEEGEEEED